MTVRTSLGGLENGSIGCGLGNKSSGEEYIIASAMSKKVGGVVKFINTRPATRSLQPAAIRNAALSQAAAKNGLITAIKAVVYVNVGANGGANSDLGEYLHDLQHTQCRPYELLVQQQCLQPCRTHERRRRESEHLVCGASHRHARREIQHGPINIQAPEHDNRGLHRSCHGHHVSQHGFRP